MTITGGSSLSEEDIERMVKDAEEHAAEDKKRREEAEARNQAEQLAYSTEKMIKDNDEKLSEEIKTEVQADVDALKAALAGEDFEAVKTAQETLMTSSQKIGEAVYAAQGEAPTEPEADAEDVVDAEVVDEDESKEDTSEDKK